MQKAGGGLIDTGDADAEAYHKVRAMCAASFSVWIIHLLYAVPLTGENLCMVHWYIMFNFKWFKMA